MSDKVSFPGSRFLVDYQDYLSQYTVACERPIKHGYDALLIGGGDLVGVAWNPDDAFKMVVNKSDILTQRSAQSNDWGDVNDENIPIHAGVLTLSGAAGLFAEPDSFRMELSVFDGTLHMTARKDADEIRIRAWVSFQENVLVLDVEPGPNTADSVSLSVSRTVNPLYGENVAVTVDGDMGFVFYEGVNDVEYALGMYSKDAEFLSVDNAVKAMIPKEGARFILTAATQNQALDVKEAVRAKIREFRQMDIETKRIEHQHRWLGFWSKSFIHTSQLYLNNLWYLNLYYMAISSQGPYPVKFNNALFNWRENDYRRWGGGFWSLNQTRSYEGLFHSDHMELMDNMFETISAHLPEARKITRHHFDIDGVWFPEIFKPWKGSVSPGCGLDGARIKDMAYPETQSINVWIRTSAAHYAMLFWRRYKMTGDLEFLRERAFPLLKGAADFLAAYLVEKDDGLFHSPMSTASECSPAGEDAISDLSCVQWLFPAVIEAATTLDEPLSEKVKYQEILDHLAPYPEWDGGYTHVKYDGKPFPLRDCVVDWAGEPRTVKRYFLWHAPQNYPVFPWGVVGVDSDNYDKAHKTYWRERYNMDWCCGDHSMPAVRLGLKDETYRQLHRIICCFQNLKQGLFMEHHDVQFVDQADKDQFQQAYLNASGTFLEMVNESFVQGHRGFIDVFSAFPNEWSGSFALLCEGGFFVTGETLENGDVQYVSIHSRLGGPCALRIPWKKRPFVRRETNGEEIDAKFDDGMLRFETERDETVVLAVDEGVFANVETKTFKAELEPCPKMLGISVLGQGIHYTHQQTWSVW